MIVFNIDVHIGEGSTRKSVSVWNPEFKTAVEEVLSMLSNFDGLDAARAVLICYYAVDGDTSHLLRYMPISVDQFRALTAEVME